MTMQIRYACDCTPSGYGNAARGYLRALAHIGLDRRSVRVIPAVFWKQDAFDAPDKDWLLDYLHAYDDRPNPERAINIVHTHPCWLGMFWTNNWYNIAVTAWETNQLPKSTFPCAAGTPDLSVVDTINRRYDEVWVPTERAKQTFLESGVTKPVIVIPHALLPELLEQVPKDVGPVIPQYHPAANGEPGAPLRFYSIGTWDPRKDPVALLQAYWKTGWKIYDPVSLFLHTPTHGNMAQQDISALRESAPGWADLPSMGISTSQKPAKWVNKIHADCDVYVTATHGEGFCLPAVEALAMGNLVVGPRGPLDHLAWAADEGFAILLDSEECDIAVMPDHAGYELGQTWCHTPASALAEGFRRALDQARNGCLPLREGAAEARRRYGVGAVGAEIKKRLDEAQAALQARSW